MPRDLPKKVRKLALRTALSAKAAEGKLIVVEAAALAEPKTAQLKGHFGKLGVSSVLVIAGAEVDTNFARAAANIAHVDVLPQQGANVYDILRRDTLVLTKRRREASRGAPAMSVAKTSRSRSRQPRAHVRSDPRAADHGKDHQRLGAQPGDLPGRRWTPPSPRSSRPSKACSRSR